MKYIKIILLIALCISINACNFSNYKTNAVYKNMYYDLTPEEAQTQCKVWCFNSGLRLYENLNRHRIHYMTGDIREENPYFICECY